MNISVIIPSGGIGSRMKSDIPKQYLEIDGIPIIIRTLMVFENIKEVENIFIPIDEKWKSFVLEKRNFFNLKKNHIFVSGGITRAESIKNALTNSLIDNSDFVLIHDAVRCLVKLDLIYRIINSLNSSDIVIPAIKINDTIKEIRNNFVVKTINRENIYRIQTPQGVKLKIYKEILNKININDSKFSDDASIFEEFGYKIKVVEGSSTNIKITDKNDLDYVKYIINKNQ